MESNPTSHWRLLPVLALLALACVAWCFGASPPVYFPSSVFLRLLKFRIPGHYLDSLSPCPNFS